MLVFDRGDEKGLAVANAIEINMRLAVCTHSAPSPVSGGVKKVVMSVDRYSIAATAKSQHLDTVPTKSALRSSILVTPQFFTVAYSSNTLV